MESVSIKYTNARNIKNNLIQGDPTTTIDPTVTTTTTTSGPATPPATPPTTP